MKLSRDPLPIELCICSLNYRTVSFSVIIEIALLEPTVQFCFFYCKSTIFIFLRLCVLKVRHILLVVEPEGSAFLSTVILVVFMEAVRTTA